MHVGMGEVGGESHLSEEVIREIDIERVTENLMESLKTLNHWKESTTFHSLHEIMAIADPDHFGSEATCSYWGYRLKRETPDSVLDIQGKGQNARAFHADIGVTCEGKLTWITVEARCPSCGDLIFQWRNFFSVGSAGNLIGVCRVDEKHISREKDWKYRIVNVRQVERFDP